MANLIRMDVYRITKSKSFWVCLIIAAALALIATPFEKLMYTLARALSDEAGSFDNTVNFSKLISYPFALLNAMLALLSASSFFYADQENGYIKNIAGQMPKKGYTVLSKFIAVGPHNLIFMVTCLIAGLLGTLPFRSVIFDGAILEGIGRFFLAFLLMQALCSILLFAATGLANRSFGTVLAVLFGTGLLALVYMGIDSGLNQIFTKKSFSIAEYMPDQLLGDTSASMLRCLIVSIITCAIFLPLTIRIIDKKDVK